MSVTSKVALSIVAVGAIAIVLLAATIYFFSYKITKDMENEVNNKLSQINKIDKYDLSFKPFKCGGFMEYQCKSKNILLSGKNEKISFDDIKLITKDLNAKKRLEIILNSNVGYSSQDKNNELLERMFPKSINANLVFLNDKDKKEHDYLNISFTLKTKSIFNDLDVNLDSVITLKKSDDSVNAIILNLVSQLQDNISGNNNSLEKVPFMLSGAKANINFNKTISQTINSLKGVDNQTKDDIKQTIIIISKLFAGSIRAKLSNYFNDGAIDISHAITLLSEDKLNQLSLNLTKSNSDPMPFVDFLNSYLNNNLDIILENIANDYNLKVILNGKS